MGYFIGKPGQLITHKEIAEHLYPDTEIGSKPSKLCRPLISRLRKRLAVLPDGNKWIETVRGKGYVFNIEISFTHQREKTNETINSKAD
jgi:DNA-binding winged helix-turn-helix (wHTH) protein